MFFHKNNLYRALIYIACIFVFNMCAKKLKPVEDEITTFENALILISMDGFRWDYIQFANTPHLDEFIRGGVQSEGIIPPFPSKTFPSHISLVTGKHPEEHGLSLIHI